MCTPHSEKKTPSARISAKLGGPFRLNPIFSSSHNPIKPEKKKKQTLVEHQLKLG